MFGPIFLIDPRAGFEMVSPLFRLRDASSARIFVTRHRTRLVGRRSILDIDPIGVSFDTRPYSSIIPVTAVPNLDPKLQRDFATEIVRTLRQRGFDALWAGGCVRDQLLGRRPKDYDIATSAQPDDVRSVFGHRRTLAVGAAFGVMIVRGPRGAGQMDVATFRRDAQYSDGRHHDAVTFSDAEHDAQRRDFTINGLFYDPITEEVIDYVEGQEDLRRRVIRTIGDPHERLSEDKLRMLRAIRFAATFDFAVEPATQTAVTEMAAEIDIVSGERIGQELRRMLTCDGRRRAAELLLSTGLLAAVLPEAAGVRPERMIDVLARAEPISLSLALAALLLDCGDAQQAATACRRIKITNRETERAAWLVENQTSLCGASTALWSNVQPLLAHDGAMELVSLHAARVALGEVQSADVGYCRERLAWPADQLDPPPLLGGDELIRHGVPRGRIFKRLLQQVRDAQLDARIGDSQEALALVDRLLDL